MQQKNAFVVEARFTMPKGWISVGIKRKSAINATRRVKRRTNFAVTVNQVVEMAENRETRITWRQQKRPWRRNTRCFT